MLVLAPISGLDFRTNNNRGDKMKAADYARMAEECLRQADAMRPGPERDALMQKVRRQNGQLGRLSGVAATQLTQESESPAIVLGEREYTLGRKVRL
jgi:hypothetical protein